MEERRKGPPVPGNRSLMIEVANISRVHRLGGQGVRALDGVDLRIEDADFVAITDPPCSCLSR